MLVAITNSTHTPTSWKCQSHKSANLQITEDQYYRKDLSQRTFYLTLSNFPSSWESMPLYSTWIIIDIKSHPPSLASLGTSIEGVSKVNSRNFSHAAEVDDKMCDCFGCTYIMRLWIPVSLIINQAINCFESVVVSVRIEWYCRVDYFARWRWNREETTWAQKWINSRMIRYFPT